MKNVNVTFRVDGELKKQADALFAELGMNLSTAFNISSVSLFVNSRFLFMAKRPMR